MHIQVTIISRLKAALSEAKGKERWREQETSLLPSWAGPTVCPERSGQKILWEKKRHLAAKCETVPEWSWPSGGRVINSERLLLHQTIWCCAGSSGAGAASGWVCLAPLWHLPLELSPCQVQDVWRERGKRGTWWDHGALQSFRFSPFHVQPLTNEGGYHSRYWGEGGGVIHMKASLERKIKAVN